MKVSIRLKDDVVIVGLEGKFIAGVNGPFLRQKAQDLLDAGTKKFVFDFSEVPYIDSTGLGFLAACRTAAEDTNARIVLSSVPAPVKKIIDRVQLTKFFPMAEDEAAALALLEAPIGVREDRPASVSKAKKSR